MLPKLPVTLRKASSRRESDIFRGFAKSVHALFITAIDSGSKHRHIIRGFLYSPDTSDRNFCIGTYESYDFVLLRRTQQAVKATLVQVDLHSRHKHPSTFILPNSLPEMLFQRILLLHPYHRQAPYHADDGISPQFKMNYSVLSLATYFQRARGYVTPWVSTLLSRPTNHYAIEIHEDRVYLYLLKSTVADTRELTQLVESAVKIAHSIDEDYAG
jgi:hypothetical protein